MIYRQGIYFEITCDAFSSLRQVLNLPPSDHSYKAVCTFKFKQTHFSSRYIEITFNPLTKY